MTTGSPRLSVDAGCAGLTAEVAGPDVEIRCASARYRLQADGTIHAFARFPAERLVCVFSVGGGAGDPWIVEAVVPGTDDDGVAAAERRADLPDVSAAATSASAAPGRASSASVTGASGTAASGTGVPESLRPRSTGPLEIGLRDIRPGERGRPGARASGRGNADARIRVRRGALRAEFRGDGVVQVTASRELPLRADASVRPTYVASVHGRVLAVDDEGGFLTFPVQPQRDGVPPATIPQTEPLALHWRIPPGREVWISALPVRPPDPALAGVRIAHEGRPGPWPDGAYPSPEVIAESAQTCRVFALHAYAWSPAPWAVRLRPGQWFLRRQQWRAPRHDPAFPDRFARVREDVRRAGMKFLVYLSPRWTTAPDLFAEATRILAEYGPDGFYVDEVADDLPRLDAVVRGLRKVVGPDRILYLNASDEPFGAASVAVPFVDAQCDFVLRGSHGTGGLPLRTFLRHVVSGRSTSGARGVWCTARGPWPESPPSEADVRIALEEDVCVWRRSLWGGAALERIDGLVSSFVPESSTHGVQRGREDEVQGDGAHGGSANAHAVERGRVDAGASPSARGAGSGPT